MSREKYACLCGFQSDHPGICPTCREEMYRVGGLWERTSVEEFHEEADGSARLSVACLYHADIPTAVVAEPQPRSKATLRERGPLADGFEGRGIHDLLGIPECDAAAQQGKACGSAIAKVAFGGQFGELLAGRADADQLAASAVADENQLTGFDDGALLVVESGHLHSPMSGGASLRCPSYRNTVPAREAQSYSVRRISAARFSAVKAEKR